MVTKRRASLWLSAVALGVSLGACQTVAGIEDRELDPDAANYAKHTARCASYCDAVLDACQGKNAVYTTRELCLGVCANLDPGDPLEPVGNTLACRAHQASVAKFEPEENCRSAGPGGDGQCGTDCEAYCGLFAKVCKENDDYPTVADCVHGCAGLTDQARFDVKADHEGDSIECRLVHVSSATVDPTMHCAHAPVRPTEPWCTGKPDEAPTCPEYCKIALAACDGDLTQYESSEQCLGVCSAFDLGTNDDEVGNNIGCRRYHSFSATLAAAQHCPHAGPTGDGHCGDKGAVKDGHTGNCESYCTILAGACSAELDATFGSVEQCQIDCVAAGGEAEPESKYTIAKAKKSTGLHCRVLHAARAFEDPTACDAAVGGDPCE